MNNNFNPMELITLIKQGQNPEQLMLSMMEQRIGTTPMGQNLISLAKNNRINDIESIARNIAQERGVNYDEAFNAFKGMIGVK